MIQSHQLTYAYPGASPLTFPNVNVPQGSGVLLSGPSGSGKSTWLALVAGLVAPSAGELTVAHQPLGALSTVASDAWRAKTIGFLPQQLHLSAALSVWQNLELTAIVIKSASSPCSFCASSYQKQSGQPPTSRAQEPPHENPGIGLALLVGATLGCGAECATAQFGLGIHDVFALGERPAVPCL